MMPACRAAIICIMLLAPTSRALAADAPDAATAALHDQAEVFNDATAGTLAEIANLIHRNYGKDLKIFTFAEVPVDRRAQLAAEGKPRFYENWIGQLGRTAGDHGVYILIVMHPGRLQVYADAATSRDVFTPRDMDQLVTFMLDRFRDKAFDLGALDGARFILGTMGRNTGRPPQTQPTGAVHD